MIRILYSLLLVAPLGVFAQAYQLNLQGTRQIGKGSTGLAQATDATALFTNPGSAAFLKENDVTVGVTPVFAKGTFTDARSNKVSNSNNPIVTPFNASAVFGKNGSKLKYGISVYTPFGSTMRWEEGSVGRFETKEISLISVSVQPTVSYKITERLGLGVGLIYTYGHVQIKKDVPVQFANGSFGSADIDCKANGFGINAGLFYKVSNSLALSATYRSAQNMNTSKGTAQFNVPAVVQGNFPNQNVNAMLPLPQVFGLGLSYAPHKYWTINAEAYLSDWSKYDTVSINYEQAPVAGASSAQLIRNYKTGYTYRLGVEYRPNARYELRAGAFYTQSPIQDKYLSPDVPDANRINPSIGASYVFSKKLRLDAAVLGEFITRKSHNVVSGIDGTYRFNIILPSIGLTYKF